MYTLQVHIFQSHIFNLAYFIKFFISSNYIPFVQIISPQKFSSHIFSLSLSQFYLQIQSNTSPPTFSVLYVFPSHPRTSQSSILRVLNLLCFDVRKLLSHPSPLTHFSIVFFFLFSSSSSSASYHHIPRALLNPLLSSIRTISPPSSACSSYLSCSTFHPR